MKTGKRMEELLIERMAFYRQAQYSVDMEGKKSEGIATEIAALIS